MHSPSNVHGGLQPNHEFASQIGHAVQEIHPVESNSYSNEVSQSYSTNSYDVLPPGVDREPPPPGFENEVMILFFVETSLALLNNFYFEFYFKGATFSTSISSIFESR